MEEKEFSIKKVLFVLMFGMFIVILNQTVVNVALPVMMDDLKVQPTTAQWLVTGFMLVNGILIPISAYLVQRFGFRKLFLIAMVFFIIGSIFCGISDEFSMVLTGRLVQAVGAGILMPLGMNVFMTVFPPEKRGSAMGTMGIAMILAPAIGPTLSGWIIEHHPWQVMFYGMAILGAVALCFAFGWFKIIGEVSKPKFDYLGTVFSTLGFGGMLYGFSEAGSKGWDSVIVISCLAVGALFLAIFFIYQLKTINPLLEVRVFKYPVFSLALAINGINTMALFGGMLLLPIYLQNILGYSPLKSGVLMLPGALIMGLMGPIAGKIFDKHGARVLAIIGLLITGVTTYEFTQLTVDTTYKFIMILYIIRSFGMSLLMMPIMTAGINALPEKLIAHGNAMTNTIRQVAGSIGSAILVTVMTSHTKEYIKDVMKDKPKVDTSQIKDPAILAQIKEKTIQLTHEATVHGINGAFMIATIFVGVAFVLAFFLKNKKPTA
jgi:EmrB/QacA subfamily drug resistance transporter